MLKILVADDEESYRDILQQFLTDSGYDVVLARNGREAHEMFMSDRPDMAILDVNMPYLSGFEVCRRVRSDPKLKKVPIMMLTVLSDVDTQVQGYELGADDYLPKPFDLKVLMARLKTLERRIIDREH